LLFQVGERHVDVALMLDDVDDVDDDVTYEGNPDACSRSVNKPRPC
jgi:hypothetical protein